MTATSSPQPKFFLLTKKIPLQADSQPQGPPSTQGALGVEALGRKGSQETRVPIQALTQTSCGAYSPTWSPRLRSIPISVSRKWGLKACASSLAGGP